MCCCSSRPGGLELLAFLERKLCDWEEAKTCLEKCIKENTDFIIYCLMAFMSWKHPALKPTSSVYTADSFGEINMFNISLVLIFTDMTFDFI